MPGGLKAASDATPEVQEIANQVKSAAEQKAGKTFDKFEAKSFSTQVLREFNINY